MLHRMQPTPHTAPPACRSDAPLSVGRAWPASPPPSVRCQNSSCTSPFANSTTFESPTLAVSFRLSALMGALISHFILHAASCLMRPLHRRDTHLVIRCHVASLIQSFPGFRIGFGSTHLAASVLKVAVSLSFGPSGRDSGSFWCLRRYVFSRPSPPAQTTVTTA
jgi:hypothetical protein